MNPEALRLWDGPVLGIETSCDETSVAVLEGLSVRANVVSSQAKLHEQWGGIVPEAASRAHVEAFLPAMEQALSESGMNLSDITAISVTNRPGLVGALNVGLTAAKGLAYALEVPFVAVHHLEGHLLSPLLDDPDLRFPHVCLLVSGGHTEIVRLEGLGAYRLLAQTRDDAAGEAFDKTARLLGLGNPGGAAIQELAQGANPERYPLPVALEKEETLDLSFSGLKTAVLRLVESEGASLDKPDAAASIQHAIARALVLRGMQATEREGVDCLTLVGGVAANERLRQSLAKECERRGWRFRTPRAEYCTDNAAMIALAGSWRLAAGQRSGWEAEPESTAPLPGPVES